MYQQIIQLFHNLHVSGGIAMHLALIIVMLGMTVLTLLVNWLLKNYILRLVSKFARISAKKIWPLLESHQALQKLSQLGAAVFLALTAPLLAYHKLSFTTDLATIVQTASVIYAVIIVVMTLSCVLDAIHTYSASVPFLKNKPIRSYFQIVKIVAWVVAGICSISLLMGKSPWVFLTGLGAISAVTMLVFKDTILGFVASIQVSAYDSVRVGDWITIKGKGVDGTVLDVAVNTVKVRNFDNTTITIPTYDLVSFSVQNWRGMTESGGRRIKRSILIDLDTIKFCDKSLLTKLSKLQHLTKYLDLRWQEIEMYNQEKSIDKSLRANGRELTNIGLFRAYIESYLCSHEKIHMGMTFLVRQLQPKETGLPLQIYVFTNDTNWVNYEGIQADIFDHLLATLPIFELRAFQFATHATQSYAHQTATLES